METPSPEGELYFFDETGGRQYELYEAELNAASITSGPFEEDDPEPDAAMEESDTVPFQDAGEPPEPPSLPPSLEGGDDDPQRASALLADRLFEMSAGYVPTDEDSEVVEAASRHLDWLGDDELPPRLLWTFIPEGLPRHESPVLDFREAAVIADSQISRLGESISTALEGTRSATALAELFAYFADTTVVEEEVIRLGPGQEHHIGQFVVTGRPDGCMITEYPDTTSPGSVTYVAYETEDGEPRIIRTDSDERYRVMDNHETAAPGESAERELPGGSISVRREALASLQPNIDHYFLRLGKMLHRHSEYLLDVAEALGIPRQELFNEEGSIKDKEAYIRLQMTGVSADARKQLAMPIRAKLVASIVSIWGMVGPGIEVDVPQQRITETGLQARANEIRAFFDALSKRAT